MGEGAKARAYFEAIEQGDRGAQREWYAEDAEVEIRGVLPKGGKAEVVAFFDELWEAVPDFDFEILDFVSEGDVGVVRWQARGTFAGPGQLQGLEPNGAPLFLEGTDVVRVRNGKVVRNDAYADSATLLRQVGGLPPEGSRAEETGKQAFNARVRFGQKMNDHQEATEVADGVWRLQGALGRCNVYFVQDGEGVLMFDAGARVMLPSVRAAAARLGGLTRVVLGHGHTDHRGTAPALGVPVYCHTDERIDAEGSGGWRYWDDKLRDVPAPHRWIHRAAHRWVWDGGPTPIAETLSEGDEVAGFRVVHMPGHAPGQITLFRPSDRIALTTDAFYTVNFWAKDVPAYVPLDAYNYDTDQARHSLRKLADLEPAAAWPGHAEPILGDVAAQLRAAAGT
ncbi:MAG: ester cyclase [Solirubrobacteraceae bacterium]|nr:ester cyclase [Solirubrobacteraceae bacterium]